MILKFYVEGFNKYPIIRLKVLVFVSTVLSGAIFLKGSVNMGENIVTFNRLCKVCEHRLDGTYGRIPISFKYCPRCGADGNPQMNRVQHGWIHWWGLELFFITWMILASIWGHFFGNAIIGWFMGAIGYIGNRLLSKTCRYCHSITSSITHSYCHNCGRKL